MIDNQIRPFEAINANGSSALLIACDHADNLIPDEMAGLGLHPDYLRQHIAYDIGAKQVAMRLAEFFDAPLLLANYSRLVVDLNRHLHDPSLIAEYSDGVEIPGNLNLTDEMRARRINHYFHPYHNQYQDMVNNLIAKHNRPIILAVHSFTPIMNGLVRPWEMGVLWNQDEVLARQLIGSLSKVTGFNIGDNQPYHATDPHGYAQAIHSHERGVELALLEIRQDLIADSDGQIKITDLVCQAVAPILNSTHQCVREDPD
ncbi:N-formylglutamate amidohydrolase [Candidatus Spongiihabitans sp.]|uniref:N-formylglutamate amidohydrolase n=1 Tax=Candidatus Spongiihabitans sp. TaxID=3101308 RepID=UPI003C7A9ACD